eukprot:Blabericola_migrator_1__4517@NODE_2407_length_2814_cov_3_574809_g1509_i0_p2_GENE_NODE_2407_length_2814_cov_3_574809_g1509_i0NODE_2407_length_2814_cov_3_574809_g1509_i0_p2_ORF_typecomplete_len214_score17_41CAP/PF00188_26/6_7e05CAP/PF00188_26/9_4e03_NODE_2407_length_2814_cov_3_574809_g1509_i011651806
MYSEVSEWDFTNMKVKENPARSPGHFTQIVQQKAQYVGCSVVTGCRRDVVGDLAAWRTYLVCEYDWGNLADSTNPNAAPYSYVEGQGNVSLRGTQVHKHLCLRSHAIRFQLARPVLLGILVAKTTLYVLVLHRMTRTEGNRLLPQHHTKPYATTGTDTQQTNVPTREPRTSVMDHCPATQVSHSMCVTAARVLIQRISSTQCDMVIHGLKEVV